MNSKAKIVLMGVLSACVVGIAYAATLNQSNDEKIAHLERTVAELQGRVRTLEEGVAVKLRLIESNPNLPQTLKGR